MTKAIVFEMLNLGDAQREFDSCMQEFFKLFEEELEGFVIAVDSMRGTATIIVEGYMDMDDEGPCKMVHYDSGWLRKHGIEYR